MRRTASIFLVCLLTGSLAAPASATVSNRPRAGWPTFNGTVLALARAGDTLYVGGDFTRVTDARGTRTRRGAAAIDTDTGRVLGWNPRVGGVVHDLLAKKEGVYLAGQFTTVGGVARRNLALVGKGGKGLVRAGLKANTNGPVYAVTATKNAVYAGGAFTRSSGSYRLGVLKLTRGRGYDLRPWAAIRQGRVNDLAATADGVLVGGTFTSVNGSTATPRLAMLSRGGGAAVGSFRVAAERPVVELAVTGRRLFVGMGGGGGGRLQVVDRATQATLWTRYFDGDVQALSVLRGEVYVGGHFDCVRGRTCGDGGAPRKKGASFTVADGTLTSWNPGANSLLGLTAVLAHPTHRRIYIGGSFTRLGTVDRPGFATYR